MKLERTIQAEIGESAMLERITAGFEKAGYRRVRTKPSLAFRRGSVFGSLAGFSPKSWNVTAIVQISSKKNEAACSRITLIIDTIGQWVTENERKFWQNELDDLQEAIVTGKISAELSTEKAKSTTVQNILSILFIVGLGAVMSFAAYALTGSRRVAALALLIGAGLGILISHRWMKFKFDA